MNSIKDLKQVDICCGLAWGDEAKGKIVSELAKSKKYDIGNKIKKESCWFRWLWN